MRPGGGGGGISPVQLLPSCRVHRRQTRLFSVGESRKQLFPSEQLHECQCVFTCDGQHTEEQEEVEEEERAKAAAWAHHSVLALAVESQRSSELVLRWSRSQDTSRFSLLQPDPPSCQSAAGHEES